MSETKTKNLCTVPAADLTDSQYFIAEDGGELKRIPKVQVVLKKLENMLATDTENLAGGGEVTAQELLDALAEQVANKLLAKSQVVNNLLATVEGNPLDATQGKALKELIDTTNNNLSKCLQYIHSETDVFDFNDPKTPAGYHRLGAAASYKNAPSGLDGVNFCTVEVVRPTISDTLAMTIYPYKKGINPPVWYKSGGSNEWPTLPWNVYATKSDLDSALVYRGVITGDLNRGRNLTIAPGLYSIQGTSSIINGPSDFGGWGIFVQFPDNLFSQMILNSPNYIKFRKYSGSDPSWSAW